MASQGRRRFGRALGGRAAGAQGPPHTRARAAGSLLRRAARTTDAAAKRADYVVGLNQKRNDARRSCQRPGAAGARNRGGTTMPTAGDAFCWICCNTRTVVRCGSLPDLPPAPGPRPPRPPPAAARAAHSERRVMLSARNQLAGCRGCGRAARPRRLAEHASQPLRRRQLPQRAASRHAPLLPRPPPLAPFRSTTCAMSG